MLHLLRIGRVLRMGTASPLLVLALQQVLLCVCVEAHHGRASTAWRPASQNNVIGASNRPNSLFPSRITGNEPEPPKPYSGSELWGLILGIVPQSPRRKNTSNQDSVRMNQVQVFSPSPRSSSLSRYIRPKKKRTYRKKSKGKKRRKSSSKSKKGFASGRMASGSRRWTKETSVDADKYEPRSSIGNLLGLNLNLLNILNIDPRTVYGKSTSRYTISRENKGRNGLVTKPQTIPSDMMPLNNVQGKLKSIVTNEYRSTTPYQVKVPYQPSKSLREKGGQRQVSSLKDLKQSPTPTSAKLEENSMNVNAIAGVSKTSADIASTDSLTDSPGSEEFYLLPPKTVDYLDPYTQEQQLLEKENQVNKKSLPSSVVLRSSTNVNNFAVDPVSSSARSKLSPRRQDSNLLNGNNNVFPRNKITRKWETNYKTQDTLKDLKAISPVRKLIEQRDFTRNLKLTSLHPSSPSPPPPVSHIKLYTGSGRRPNNRMPYNTKRKGQAWNKGSKPYRGQTEGSKPYRGQIEGSKLYRGQTVGSKPYRGQTKGSKPYRGQLEGSKLYRGQTVGSKPYRGQTKGSKPYRGQTDYLVKQLWSFFTPSTKKPPTNGGLLDRQTNKYGRQGQRSWNGQRIRQYSRNQPRFGQRNNKKSQYNYNRQYTKQTDKYSPRNRYNGKRLFDKLWYKRGRSRLQSKKTSGVDWSKLLRTNGFYQKTRNSNGQYSKNTAQNKRNPQMYQDNTADNEATDSLQVDRYDLQDRETDSDEE